MGGKWGSESRQEIQRLLPFFFGISMGFLIVIYQSIEGGIEASVTSRARVSKKGEGGMAGRVYMVRHVEGRCAGIFEAKRGASLLKSM